MSDNTSPPHVLTEEEIELYLKGDRREIDRLILYSINRLTAVIIPHAKREDDRDAEADALIDRLGGVDAMHSRALFVDELIARQQVKNRMMEKVSQSTVVWAFIAFCGFVAVAVWDSLIKAIKIKLGA